MEHVLPHPVLWFLSLWFDVAFVFAMLQILQVLIVVLAIIGFFFLLFRLFR